MSEPQIILVMSRHEVRHTLRFPLTMAAVCLSAMFASVVILFAVLISLPVVAVGMLTPMSFGHAMAERMLYWRGEVTARIMKLFMHKAMSGGM